MTLWYYTNLFIMLTTHSRTAVVNAEIYLSACPTPVAQNSVF